MHGRPAFFWIGIIGVKRWMWNDLWIAMALMLVLEGIVPFLSPGTLRRMMAAMAQMDDRSLRVAGLISMLAGVALLYLVH
jgi:uncharacterized protein YjeT (DUF2065 family)